MVCQLLNFHCHSYKVSDLLFLCLSFVTYKLLEYLKLKQSVSYPLFFLSAYIPSPRNSGPY